MEKQDEFNRRNDEKPSNSHRRIFKIELGDSNQIFYRAMNVLKFFPSFRISDSEETSWCADPTSKTRNSKNSKMINFRSDKLVRKKHQEREKNSYFRVRDARVREDCLTSYPQELKSKKINEIRQVDVHFSLQRLALMVKIYMEENSQAVLENIYMHILIEYLEKMGIGKEEADELLCSVRKRICEVLKVMDGIGVISLDRKIVSLTKLGELQGKALFRESRRRRQAYEDKKKQLLNLIQKRTQLSKQIKMLQSLKKRNEKLLTCTDKERSQLDPEEYLLELPMTFITGPPRKKFSIFQPQEVDHFRRVEVDKQSGLIRIQGDNLRVVQMKDVLNFLSLS